MKESYEKAIALYTASLDAGLPADRCQCCGANIREGLKGCFELFSDLLNCGYSAPAYSLALFYGVDAHALQHPEIHGKKNNAAHLLRLCWIFEYNAHAQSSHVPAWWQRYMARNDLPLLYPPADRGSITIIDITNATTVEQYTLLMREWAQATYYAWMVHHGWARATLAQILG